MINGLFDPDDYLQPPLGYTPPKPLPEHVRRIGRRGVARARAVLREARCNTTTT